jgi:uncharacterized protein (TIGR01777 family)
MKIVLTGATGCIGKSLVKKLLEHHHDITVIGRSKEKILKIFPHGISAYSWEELPKLSADTVNAVINLAGENIAAKRWSKQQKQKIIASRTFASKTMLNWCLTAKKCYPHLYNASAIGIYGLQKTTTDLPLKLTEQSITTSHDFLSIVGQQWEAAASTQLFPVTFLRFGIILKRHDGILAKLEPAFRMGMGALLGSGNQILSWIDIDDVTQAILFLLQHPEVTGPVNLCSPEAVSQRQFATTIATCMKKPLLFTLPAFMIKVLFGQMGEELLLNGQNIYPQKLLDLGFQFSYPLLVSSLQKELSK